MIVRIFELNESSLPTYEELSDSPIESIVQNEYTATRKFKVSWVYAEDFALLLLGSTSFSGYSGTELIINYNTPHHYPHSLRGFLGCREVSIQPFGRTSTSSSVKISHTDAIVEATYRVVPEYYIDHLQEEEIHPAAEFLTLSNQKLYWVGGSEQDADTALEPEAAPGKIIYTTEWTYVAKQLPRVPYGTLEWMGTINETAIVSTKFGFRFYPKTLLYIGVEIEEEQTMRSAEQWTVRFKYMWKPEGWNYFYRPGYEFAQVIYAEGSSSDNPMQVYQTAELNELFFWEG